MLALLVDDGNGEMDGTGESMSVHTRASDPDRGGKLVSASGAGDGDGRCRFGEALCMTLSSPCRFGSRKVAEAKGARELPCQSPRSSLCSMLQSGSI